MHSKEPGIGGYSFILVFQIVICIIFAVVTDYDEKLLPENFKNETVIKKVSGGDHGSEHVASYPRKFCYG